MWYPGSGVVLDVSIPDLCLLTYFKWVDVLLLMNLRTVHLVAKYNNMGFSNGLPANGE